MVHVYVARGVGVTGVLCEHALDFCVSAPCRNGGTCVGDAMTYVCECDPRYTGTHCETLVKCSANPCQHATSCQDYVSILWHANALLFVLLLLFNVFCVLIFA